MMPTDPRSRASAQIVADMVLVVDDDADLPSLIQELLEMAGYCVATAANGAEAIRWGERQRPKGIILDLTNPPFACLGSSASFGGNGNESLQCIGHNPHR